MNQIFLFNLFLKKIWIWVCESFCVRWSSFYECFDIYFIGLWLSAILWCTTDLFAWTMFWTEISLTGRHLKPLFWNKIFYFWTRNFFLIYVFVSPERSSERDYVITDSVRSMCMYVYVCSMCMYVYVCGNFCKIDHFIIPSSRFLFFHWMITD